MNGEECVREFCNAKISSVARPEFANHVPAKPSRSSYVDPHAAVHICEVCEQEFEPSESTRHPPSVAGAPVDLSHLSSKERKRLRRAQSKSDKRTRRWKRRHGVRACPQCGLEFYKHNGVLC
jgi:hypothetical protein